MADYWVKAYTVSDFFGAAGAESVANAVAGDEFVGGQTYLSPDAVPIRFQISDDDDSLKDTWNETDAPASLTDDLTIDGVTYPGGTSNIECEFSVTTDSSPPVTLYIGRIGTGEANSGTNLLVFVSGEIEPGTTFTLVSTADHVSMPYDTVCFAAGTMIDTIHGPTPVEHLCPGDKVLTRDSGAQRIIWVGQQRLSARDLARAPHLAPIRIRAGALGGGMPCTDLVVSPQHRVLIDDWRAEHYFGETSILAPAKALCNDQNVTIDLATHDVTYCHILLEHHELIRANGQWAETLMLGPQAIKTLGKDQVAEIECIFPGLMFDQCLPASPVLSASEAAILQS